MGVKGSYCIATVSHKFIYTYMYMYMYDDVPTCMCVHMTTLTLNDGVGFVPVAMIVWTLVTRDALAVVHDVSGPAADTAPLTSAASAVR